MIDSGDNRTTQPIRLPHHVVSGVIDTDSNKKETKDEKQLEVELMQGSVETREKLERITQLDD